MIDTAIKNKIDRFISSIDSIEPVILDLGTPQLELTPEMKEILDAGPAIVPYLFECTRFAPPKTVAYIALMLRHFDDPQTIETLKNLKQRYAEIEKKTLWDYAIIGQCNLAMRR